MNYDETLKAIVAEVRKVAEERPDYVYDQPMCVYVYDGKPACLVGQALWRLGLIDETLEEDDSRNGEKFRNFAPKLLGVDSDLLEGRVDVGFLDLSQTHQDDGRSWGEAVRKADAMLGWFEEL